MQTELPTVKPSQLKSIELSLRNRSMATLFASAMDLHVSPDFTVYGVPRQLGRGVPVVGAGVNVMVECGNFVGDDPHEDTKEEKLLSEIFL